MATSWADIMSDSEPDQISRPATEAAGGEGEEEDEEDMCDHLLRYFPVPGEI
jgi:hypothetical protein